VRAAAAAAAADFCCCCCAPPPRPAPPLFLGGGKYQKKSPVASGLAFGHVCVGVGVLGVLGVASKSVLRCQLFITRWVKNPDPQPVRAGIGEPHKSTYVISANIFSLLLIWSPSHLEKGPYRCSPLWMCNRCCSLRACATTVGVVAVIVFMLVVHGRWCILVMFIFIAVKKSSHVVCLAIFSSVVLEHHNNKRHNKMHGRRIGQKVDIWKGLGYGIRNLFWS
jgi:hypothetical protein